MVVEFPWWFYPILVWTLFWKGVAMWKSARNNQAIWFVASLVINTFGILPIIYLRWFQQDWNKRSAEAPMFFSQARKKRFLKSWFGREGLRRNLLDCLNNC
ncbi:MAG: hypothetical protein KKF50_04490 [Nanoarchaeota archaeon]|nr:hypothetical protein [Nanoarchaeota archaeon]